MIKLVLASTVLAEMILGSFYLLRRAWRWRVSRKWNAEERERFRRWSS